MSQKMTDLERQWFLTAANNQVDDVKNMLQENPELLSKKDFMMGFTALHWAAKNGEYDLVSFLLERGIEACPKTNGGYTPLHLATMYNRDDVIVLLIDNYGADVDVRDNSGKRAKDYLRKNAMPSVKDRLQTTNSMRQKANPMTNLSSMFMQMYTVPSAQPFCLLPQPLEIKPDKRKNSEISRSPSSEKFRKAKTILRRPSRAACDDLKAEAKAKISSPIPLGNNNLDINGKPRDNETTIQGAEITRLDEQLNSEDVQT